MTTKAEQLFTLAREIADAIPNFQMVRGPGSGDRATRAFMEQLRTASLTLFAEDYSEQKLCGDTSFAANFYFPDEGTIVEVALGLPNSASEFEKDVLKALMARESGFDVRCLFFISRPGGAKKCSQPGRSAITKWAKDKHQLKIEVHDLSGEPRIRQRNRSVRAAN